MNFVLVCLIQPNETFLGNFVCFITIELGLSQRVITAVRWDLYVFYQSISLKLKSGPQCTVLSKSNSCRRWTRTTRCLSRIVLYTGGRASAMNWPSRRSTVASIVNFDRRSTTVASLPTWAPTFVERSWQHVATTNQPRRDFLSPELR